MEWHRIFAYITGSVDEELLLRNEYLAAENRILRARIKGQLALTNPIVYQNSSDRIRLPYSHDTP